MHAKVLIDSKSPGIADGLTYEVPVGTRIGSAVRVSLRRKFVEGIVLDITEKKVEEKFAIKKITDILEDQPILTGAQINTLKWMSEYYYCSLRQALTVWLPGPPWSKLLPEQLSGYRLNSSASTPLKGRKQQQIIDYMTGKEWVSKAELVSNADASAAALKSLVTKALLIEEKHVEEIPAPSLTRIPVSALPVFTPLQRTVYEEIKSDARPSLLFGITGSGKTEVYAQLIADTVNTGKQAILLVPEILLTEHIIQRFEHMLPRSSVSIIHSKIGAGQRRNEWKRIHRGEVSLVIGSRSALFAPLQNLGLIIMDEEHEWTYKNEQAPRYHARETAEVLTKFSKAKLVLGTATPSLEAWAKSKSGTYQLVRLPERYNHQTLPTVQVIDLADLKFGSLYPFSKPLLDAIADRLSKKEQVVLFLNHRGVASSLLCLECRRRIVSPESQLPFTVHESQRGEPFLMDHTTGTRANVPASCPHCRGTNLLAVGAGTQKIETLLGKQFPGARLLRADRDTITTPEGIRTLLRTMQKREADILLGTQLVVKGLDLPQVTLAAVLVADIGFSLPHFRAGERIFQLLTQLTGRSGRAKPGEVIIQTFRPTASEIQFAANHQTEQYLESEMKLRIFAGYPPASNMIRLLLKGATAESDAKRLQGTLQATAVTQGNDAKISISPTFFGGGKIWHVLLRGSNPRQLLQSIDLNNVTVDVDPVETL